MIPTLIIWLCKKYIAPKIKEKTLRKALRLKGTAAILTFLLCMSAGYAQTTKFVISRNGKVIGEMAFSCNQDGDNTFFRMSSRVNTRFVFKIDVETHDVSHFRNGKLLTSSTKRKVNGELKEPKETKWVSNGYQTLSGSKMGEIKHPICYNMMLMYAKEPISIAEVYSDNFQCFLPITKKGEHQYRINLPDGNYNDYLFENGICKRVIVNHTMYTIKMERV